MTEQNTRQKPEHDATGRLESWKEIAAYLRRQVRTVNLWEKTEALPVHRHLHSKRGTVFAYKSELDEWRQHRALRTPAAGLTRRSRSMIAVLPFRNLSGDATQDYFSDGLTEEMISQLGRIDPERLGVIARASSMHYKDSEETIAVIGAHLDVEFILAGSVRTLEDRVRITARLISVREQSDVWSQTYERSVADIFFIQTEVASRIADSVLAKLESPVCRYTRKRAATTSREAYEAYLKARNYWNQRTEESLLKSVHYFHRALSKDPQLAVAHCGLGDAYNLLAVYGVLPPFEAMPLARAAATRALEINRDLGEAHACLGDVSAFYDWDWDTAREEYQRALALNPSYATAHHFYAYFLAAIGEHRRALAEIKLAHAYDPHSMIISVWTGILLRLSGNYDDAIEVCLETTRREPQYVLGRWALGLSYEAAGEMDSALTQLKVAASLSGSSPVMLASLAYNRGLQGQRRPAMDIVNQLHALSAKRYVSAYDLATAHLGVGDLEHALQHLEKAFSERSPWIVTAPIEPRMQRLAAHPIFQSLIRKLRLPSGAAIRYSTRTG